DRVVLGAEALRDGARIGRLVERGFAKAKIERSQRAGPRARHVVDHETRVDAPGEKRAERYVGDELGAHAVADRGIDAIDQLRAVERQIARGRYVPIALDLEPPVARGPYQLRGGGKLPDRVQERMRGERRLAGKVIAERLVVDLPGKSVESQKRRQRRAEREAGRGRIEERLDAHPVARREQHALVRVPYGE